MRLCSQYYSRSMQPMDMTDLIMERALQADSLLRQTTTLRRSGMSPRWDHLARLEELASKFLVYT